MMRSLSRDARRRPPRFRSPSLRRAALAAMVAIVAALLPGCERNSPQGVARRYVESLRKANYATCYSMLADRDRKARTLAEFLTEIPLGPDVGPALFHHVVAAMQFEVGDAQQNQDSAFVSLRVTAPDLPIWERTLDAAAPGVQHFGGQNAEKSLRDRTFPRVTYHDGIQLVKEGHRWRVVADFADRDRIVDLHREAIVEYHQFEYSRVIDGYRSMIAELGRLNFTGAAGLAARYGRELAGVEKARSQAPAAAAYAAKSLAMSEVAMSMSEERVPAIFGKIANNGDRAIDAIEVTVNWYPDSGKDLKSAYVEKHPIVMTPIEFTDFSVPVVPLVPGEKRSFGFILNAPVEVQQNSSPYIIIGAVNFTYLKAPLPVISPPHPAAPAPAPAPTAAPGSAPASSPPGMAVDKAAAGPSPQLNSPHEKVP